MGLLGGAAIALTPACNDAGGDGSDDGISSLADEAPESGNTNVDTQTTDQGDGPKLDMIGNGDGGSGGDGPVDDGCDKVDFLFVIDSSVSMGDQQVALIASFPGFMDTIEQMLPANTDYRVMVVDTDGVSRCTPETCAAASDANVIDLCINDGRGGHACNGTFTACDTVLGAGVVHPSGEGSSNGICFNDPNRWIEGSDAQRDEKFSCAAQLGLAGHPSERPMDAMVAALQPNINGGGGCNQGFLRDDAVLVVTFISDDPNYEDAGTPTDWYNAVVTAKLGDPTAAVVLGLIPQAPDCSQKNGAISGMHWQEFVGMFGDYGFYGSVCSPEYVSFFAEAVAIIADACDNYVPPG